MHPQHPVVAPVEVAHQHPAEVLSQKLGDDLPAAALTVLEVAHRRAGEAPEIAVLAPFPPACLVPVHHRTPPQLSDEPLSLIHISEPTRLGMISYAVFCLKKKKNN